MADSDDGVSRDTFAMLGEAVEHRDEVAGGDVS
jgi:hypothetical protein